MKRQITFVFLAGLMTILLFGCGGSSNTNISTNRTNSMNSNMSNSNMMNSNMSNTTSMTNSNMAVVVDNFWINAAQGGMAEVELAKLALQKSQNPEVKKFAQMMVTDHSKANSELKALAAKKNVVLPTDMGSHKSTMDDLSKLSGAEFDKAYVEAMIEDHETDVDLFEDNTTNSDADIKAFTTKTLPTLKSHLEMIKGIQGKMK